MTKQCKCDTYYTCVTCRRADTFTYEQIGLMLGISHQRVQQIERKALEKMYNAFKLLNINTMEDLL